MCFETVQVGVEGTVAQRWRSSLSNITRVQRRRAESCHYRFCLHHQHPQNPSESLLQPVEAKVICSTFVVKSNINKTMQGMSKNAKSVLFMQMVISTKIENDEHFYLASSYYNKTPSIFSTVRNDASSGIITCLASQ